MFKSLVLIVSFFSFSTFASDSEYLCTGQGYEFRVVINGMTKDEKLLYTLNGTKYTALFDKIQEELAFFGSNLGKNYLIMAFDFESNLSSLNLLGVEDGQMTSSGVISCY
jgi:hypothetical protein